MSRIPYLIVGNSAAAVGAVEGIRSADGDRPITIVAAEPHHTYSRPLISYLLGGEVAEDRMSYRPADFYTRNNVQAVLGVEIAGVLPAERAAIGADGRRFEFEKLLIATGGKPIVPPDVTATATRGVFTFTTWKDARDISAYIRDNSVRRAAVIGGGLIGLKCMEALYRLGIETTVVELAERILSITFDETASDLARRHLEECGVRILCGTTAERILCADGAVRGLVLTNGTRLDCQLVIFAIGVRPNVDLVRGTEIRVERGIVCDETMQTSAPGIYAAGDVAQVKDLLTGASRPIPILPNAYRQGFIAGCNMAGRTRRYRGAIAMNSVDVLGLPTISVGITAGEHLAECETLSVLDARRPAYKKVVLRRGRAVGAIFIGDIDRAGIITGIIRDGLDVSAVKDLLLTDQFGLISLPAEYRKHVVSGLGIEV